MFTLRLFEHDIGSKCYHLRLLPVVQSLVQVARLKLIIWFNVNVCRAVITFGLNALIGRRRASKDGLYVGNMNPYNAYNLMKYSLSKGYKIDSWELGT